MQKAEPAKLTPASLPKKSGKFSLPKNADLTEAGVFLGVTASEGRLSDDRFPKAGFRVTGFG